jgi:hypothetical protein
MFRPTSRLPVAAAAIAAATTIAACGASSSPNSTSAGGAAPSPAQLAQAQHDLVRFAGCLRTHGVPSVPDPTSPRQFKSYLGDNQSPAAHSAEAACRRLLPRGGPDDHSAPAPTHAQMTSYLAFAHCVRGHGFPRFPDPSSTGELSHEMLANAGINVHLPALREAADACVGGTHGLLTRAAVARFVAGH